jgi:hypothetical protein
MTGTFEGRKVKGSVRLTCRPVGERSRGQPGKQRSRDKRMRKVVHGKDSAREVEGGVRQGRC